MNVYSVFGNYEHVKKKNARVMERERVIGAYPYRAQIYEIAFWNDDRYDMGCFRFRSNIYADLLCLIPRMSNPPERRII